MKRVPVVILENGGPRVWAHDGDVIVVFCNDDKTWTYYIQAYWDGVLAYEEHGEVFASAEEAEAAARANYEGAQ